MDSLPPFEDLVTDYGEEIFAYLWRRVRDDQDAEDCLQETYLSAFRAYPRLAPDREGGHNLRAWLYRIATNVAHTHLKRRTRRLSRDRELEPRLAGGGPSIPRRVEGRLTLSEVHAAVTDLPEKQRTALILRKYQSLTYREIAAVLDSTPAAARANVYQALRKLRERFPELTGAGQEGER